MSAGVRQSLFDPPSASVIDTASGWIESTLLGTAAQILCVLAVAIVGLTMLTGRLPVRRGLQVILGCFVLFGAPVIAGALVSSVRERPPLPSPPRPPVPIRVEAPPAPLSAVVESSPAQN